MLDSHTVGWKTVTIFYDNTVMKDGEAMKELIMQLQKRISIVVFDISVKPVKEILSMKHQIGKNFFVIGKQETAKKIYDIVSMLKNILPGIINCHQIILQFNPDCIQ